MHSRAHPQRFPTSHSGFEVPQKEGKKKGGGETHLRVVEELLWELLTAAGPILLSAPRTHHPLPVHHRLIPSLLQGEY